MKMASIKNLSLVGLLLMLASAVTAAILPKNNSKKTASGIFQLQSVNGLGAQLTCKEKPLIGAQTECDFTATDGQNSFTSEQVITSDDAITTGHGVETANGRDNFSNTGIELNVDGIYVSE